MPKEAEPGEFTLVFNVNNKVAHPAAIQVQHHELLQAFLKAIPIIVDPSIIVTYTKADK
jgi:hypothetical protein